MTRKATIAVVVLVGLALSACRPSGYTYLHNSQAGSYAKVPSDWHVFEAKEVSQHRGAQLPAQAALQLDQREWIVAFDASPQPSIEHVFDIANPGDFPVGRMSVRQLRPEERVVFSLQSLRNEFIPIDMIFDENQDAIDVLRYEELSTPDGHRGIRMVISVPLTGGVATYEQISYVDAKTQQVYLLAVGCKAACFDAHSSQINQITDSWTVKEPTV